MKASLTYDRRSAGLPPGVAVDLYSVAPQKFYDQNGNLLLTLILTNPGAVQFSF